MSDDVVQAKLVEAKDLDRAKWVSPFVAAFALVGYGLITRQQWARWNFADEVFLRLAAALALAALAIVVSLNLQNRLSGRKADWWKVGEKLDAPSWEDVRRMTIGDEVDDPVAYNPDRGWRYLVWSFVKVTTGYVLAGSLFIEATSVLIAGPILPRLLAPTPAADIHPSGQSSVDLSLSANLTALLALIAAGVSIIFTYRQLQAKVRADSRQAWIDKLRTHVAQFIALVDASHEGPGKTPGHQQTIELNRCRLEMELMLNPSEKDHRLLMYLGLRLAFFDIGEKQFAHVHDVRNIRKAIQLASEGYSEARWAPLLGPIPDQSVITREALYSDLVGYMMRLAHVVLKREWERVKATR